MQGAFFLCGERNVIKQKQGDQKIKKRQRHTYPRIKEKSQCDRDGIYEKDPPSVPSADSLQIEQKKQKKRPALNKQYRSAKNRV
jgi:hypothetical protein